VKKYIDASEEAVAVAVNNMKSGDYRNMK